MTRAPAARQSWWAPLAATTALVVLTLAGTAGYSRVFATRAWVVPVVVTVLGGHLCAGALRRVGMPSLPAIIVGMAAVALLGTWTVGSVPTWYGVPDHATVTAVVDDLRLARIRLASAVTPVVALRGFVLLAAWAAGLVTILGDWGTFRLRSAAQGLVPACGLFVLCGAIGAPEHRVAVSAIMVASVIGFVLVQRMTAGSTTDAWFGGRRGRSARRLAARGTMIGALAVVVVVAVNPFLPSHDGRGALGWKAGPGGDDGIRSVESPIVDLRTRLVEDSTTEVFTVKSPVPSYWRLTSLDTFTGSIWESTDTYQQVGHTLPGAPRPRRGQTSITEDFHIKNLDSIWLPAAFEPEAVTGAGDVTYDPISASLLTSRSTSDGLTYQVASVLPGAGLDAVTLTHAGALPAGGALRRYLQLPRAIPASVVALAHRITAGARTEYARAIDIERYLRGPLFTYSLHPPTDGYGISALRTFLLDTRTGYCQQFAGSYAVLARIVGVPTRLAVGFVTGTEDASGTYHVTDADAHTWPEVYFPGDGWVPFEPTKGNGFAIPGGDAYTGSTLGGATSTVTPPVAITTPHTAPSQAPVATTAPSAVVAPRIAVHATRARPHAILRPAVLGLMAAIGLALVWAGATVAWRRRRWRKRRRATEGRARDRVLLAWHEVGDELALQGVRRRPEETFAEFTARVTTTVAPLGTGSAGSVALTDLARAAEQAAYAEQPPGAVAVAVEESATVRRLLRSHLSRATRARHVLDA